MFVVRWLHKIEVSDGNGGYVSKGILPVYETKEQALTDFPGLDLDILEIDVVKEKLNFNIAKKAREIYESTNYISIPERLNNADRKSE